jgi:hypothetical protein
MPRAATVNNGSSTPETDDDKLDYGNDFTPTGDDADGSVSDDDFDAALEALKGKKNADAEPDDDVDPKAVADADADDDADDDDKKDSPTIPKSRFDEATGKLKKQIEELEAKLQNQQQPAPRQNDKPQLTELQQTRADLSEAREIYEKALIENDVETAADARAMIEQLEEESLALVAQQAVEQARTTSSADRAYETALAKLEATHPVIDPDSDDFDRAVMQRVARISSALQASGTSAVDALKEAADLVLPKVAPEKKADETDDRRDPNNLLRDRAKNDRKTAAKTAATQGQDLSDIGSSRGSTEPVIKPSKLSQDQFAKLPEEVLKQLRGDVVAPE